MVLKVSLRALVALPSEAARRRQMLTLNTNTIGI
jgi:hypothetical protein